MAASQVGVAACFFVSPAAGVDNSNILGDRHAMVFIQYGNTMSHWMKQHVPTGCGLPTLVSSSYGLGKGAFGIYCDATHSNWQGPYEELFFSGHQGTWGLFVTYGEPYAPSQAIMIAKLLKIHSAIKSW